MESTAEAVLGDALQGWPQAGQPATPRVASWAGCLLRQSDPLHKPRAYRTYHGHPVQLVHLNEQMTERPHRGEPYTDKD